MRSPSRQRRLLANARGQAAERAVLSHLEERGFVLLWQNLKLGHDELDLVMRQGNLLVVVEVRMRSSSAHVGGFGSIDVGKRLRILRAVRSLLRHKRSELGGIERVRIDVVAVSEGPDGLCLQHAEAAITAH